MALEVGSQFGRYEVTALIGEGGMGQPGNGCLSRGTPRSGEAPLGKASSAAPVADTTVSTC